MGINKLEKRSKKTKKIKNRGCELVDNGESSGVADFSRSNVKDDATDINENNVPAVHVKAHKSKKIHNSKKKDSTPISNEYSSAVDNGENFEPAAEDPPNKVKKDKSKKIRNSKKKDSIPISNEYSGAVDNGENFEPAAEDPSNKVKKDKSNKINKNKRKRMLVSDVQIEEVNDAGETEQFTDGSKRKKDKSKRARKNKAKDALVSSEQSTVVNDGEEIQLAVKEISTSKKDKSKRARKNKAKDALVSSEQSTVVNDGEEIQPAVKENSTSKKGKSKETLKQRKTSHSIDTEPKAVPEVQVVTQDVYQISSGEDDDSKGMKKWIKEYHERRPGIKVLQDQIDDYITTYEEKEEQAKRDKQASLAEDGWTVVVRHKGGKKTTDTESGVAVGSVAEAAVREKLAMKKTKDVGLDFYRFQRKETNRSEIMKLQSKFMEDKKRIQQLRAARKFRPY